MPSKEEKDRRKLLLQQVKQEKRARGRAQLPLDNKTMRELFDYVDAKLSDMECDNDLTHTRAFLSAAGLPQDKTILWLQDHGGYCDCEALANAEDEWEEITRGS
jgi:hypothetical protein